uniref:Salivary lipocalin n=1 Tax=Triatoma infestans TaxID=30076 RepID=A6YPI0_TRIIF|nr:salivary lipocalin [Triatoma infestans]
MKTIITVIFAGILTYTGAQKNGCNVPGGLQPMGRTFNKNSFFTGNWYVTHMKDATNAYDAVCRKYNTYPKDDHMKLDTDGDYTINKEQKHYITTCSSKYSIPLITHGSIPFDCKHSYNNGDTAKFIFFTVLWTIIDTNYQDYALAYRCTRYNDGSIHSGNLVLLQRNKKDNGSKATSSLASHKLTLSNFQNLNC